MRSAASTKVELDRIRPPGTVRGLTCDDEVDGEASKCAFRGEPSRDLYGFGADRTGVSEVCRKSASQVFLPAGAAEHLVVRRKQLNVAQRSHPQLDARASQLCAGEPFFDDTSEPLEVGQVGINA
jgi:hypothetical protein